MTLRYNTNKSLTISSSTKGVTIGEGTTSGNTVEAKITVPAGTETLTLTFANTTSSNARLDNILLYQGVAKKPAGLSWGTAARTVTIGSAENQFPPLANANKLNVKYSSSDEKVATINERVKLLLLQLVKQTSLLNLQATMSMRLRALLTLLPLRQLLLLTSQILQKQHTQ